MRCYRNMKIKLHKFYKSYKFALACAIVVAVTKVINVSEMYIIDSIILVSKPSRPPPSLIHHKSHACPYRLVHTSDSISSQFSELYWSEKENEDVYKIRKFAQYFPYIFTGILSDMIGGQKLLLISLIVSSSIIGAQYLTLFKNAHIFIVMVAIRRFGEGIMTIAWVSFAVNWTKPNRRSTFIGITVASLEIGYYFGYFIIKNFYHWKHVCYFSSLLGFITAFWWWMICSRPEFRFTPTNRITRIPWRSMFKKLHFYTLIFLCLSESNVRFILFSFLHYLREVLHFDLSPVTLSRYMLVVLFPVTGLISGLFFGLSSDYLINKMLVMISTVRKFFMVLVLVAIFVVTMIITQTRCNTIAAFVCFIVMLFFSCVMRANIVAITIDMAPYFACTLYGVTNFIGRFVSISSTLYLTKHVSSGNTASLDFWNIIFYITAVYTVLTTVPYLICPQSMLGSPTERPVELRKSIASHNLRTSLDSQASRPPQDESELNLYTGKKNP